MAQRQSFCNYIRNFAGFDKRSVQIFYAIQRIRLSSLRYRHERQNVVLLWYLVVICILLIPFFKNWLELINVNMAIYMDTSSSAIAHPLKICVQTLKRQFLIKLKEENRQF